MCHPFYATPLRSLVTPTWLASNFPAVSIIDASWFMPNANFDPLVDHLRARIPGARFLHIDDVTSGFCAVNTQLPHMLPPAQVFENAAIRYLRLKPGQPAVIYTAESPPFCASARVWWMLRAFGKSDVYVLDGGLPAWKAAGMTIEEGAVDDNKTADDEQQMSLGFQLNLNLVKNMDQMLNRHKNEVVIDARPTGRFFGFVPEPRPGLSSGHMPHSLNVPSSELVGEDGCMKSDKQLYEIFLSRGIDVDMLAKLDKEASNLIKVTTTCGSGVTAAIVALALDQLGIEAAIYDGSWVEYAASGTNPIVKG